MKTTANDIRNLVANNMESGTKDGLTGLILETLKPLQGKKITKRLATAVEKVLGEEARVSYSKPDGWSGAELSVWGVEGRSYSNRLWLNFPKEDTFDVDAFMDRNPAYYRAADERNEKRRDQLVNDVWLQATANAVNRVRELREQLAAAEEVLNEVTAYPVPDQYAIKDLAKIAE